VTYVNGFDPEASKAKDITFTTVTPGLARMISTQSTLSTSSHRSGKRKGQHADRVGTATKIFQSFRTPDAETVNIGRILHVKLAVNLSGPAR